MIFKKKKLSLEVEEYRFDAMMSLIKDLPRADYNRLKKAMDLGYDAYQTVRNVKTVDEREVEDIEKVEKSLEKAE